MPVRKRFCHIEVESDDLTDVIYSAGSGAPRSRKRYVNRQKLASIPKKTMKDAIGIPIIPNDLSIIVHADSLGQICSREIKNGAFTRSIAEEPADFGDENLERWLWDFDPFHNDGGKPCNFAMRIYRLGLGNNYIFPRTSDLS